MKRHHDVLAYEGGRRWTFLQIIPEGHSYNGPYAHRLTPLHEEGDPMCFVPRSMDEGSDDRTERDGDG